MNMKRIEAKTLEEAYSSAAKAFNCSITEINYEIVQYPTTGVMGLFKKTAIIVAVRKNIETKVEAPKAKKSVIVPETKPVDLVKPKEDEPKDIDLLLKEQEEDKVLDSFFESKSSTSEEKKEPKQKELKKEEKSVAFEDDRDAPQNREYSIEIEKKLIELMKVGCFNIDTVEVDVFNNTAHIFIDGDDAALLIGKEGYRYNALSYMLFNWINAHYDLYIKLEIAEFIQSQEEMIVNYLKPIIEHIEKNGRGKTKPLDGILVQIALELLRKEFPNKYVAIKTARDGRKFIIINNFNGSKK